MKEKRGVGRPRGAEPLTWLTIRVYETDRKQLQDMAKYRTMGRVIRDLIKLQRTKKIAGRETIQTL